MVFVNDKKYACETCIKGHRSSTCQHTDRPLFEIKKKGRPVTQCEHCRKLRKTKQVHVKCLCEGKAEEITEVSHSIPAKKANRKIGPVSAAFPNGLQVTTEMLASRAAAAAAAGDDSSEEQSDQRMDAVCSCKEGESCVCCTPRRPVVRGQEKVKDSGSRASAVSTSARTPTPPKPKVGNLRAIASRPAPPPIVPNGLANRAQSADQLPYGTSQLRPLSHGNAARHSHGSALFNPYGFAHERHGGPQDQMQLDLQGTRQGVPPSMASYAEQPYNSGAPVQLPVPWENIDQLPEDFFAVLCTCGDACACPGCVQHRGIAAFSEQAPASDSCANPTNCMACQNCAIDSSVFAQQAGLGAVFDPAALEEWLQSQSLDGSGSVYPRSPTSDLGAANMGVLPQFMNMGITSGNTSPYGALPPPQFDVGGGRCRCPPGQCKCSEGSSDCAHDDGFNTNALRYATSGERHSARYPGQPGSGSASPYGLASPPAPFHGMARMPPNVGPGPSTSHAALASYMAQSNANMRRSASTRSQSSGGSSESGSEASGGAGMSNTMRIASQAGFRPILPKGQSSFSSGSSRR